MTSSTATVGCSRHRDGQKRHLPEGRFSTIQVESTLKPHTCFRCSSTNATISILHAPPRLSPKHSAAYQLTSHGWESAAAAVYAQHAVEPYIPNPAPTLGANTATAPSAQLRNGRTELPNEHHRHTPLHSCSHRQLVRPSSRSHRVLDARRCREDRAAVCRGRAVGHAGSRYLVVVAPGGPGTASAAMCVPPAIRSPADGAACCAPTTRRQAARSRCGSSLGAHVSSSAPHLAYASGRPGSLCQLTLPQQCVARLTIQGKTCSVLHRS